MEAEAKSIRLDRWFAYDPEVRRVEARFGFFWMGVDRLGRGRGACGR